MMGFALFGSMLIAGLIGYASEKTGWTKNGYLPSILICIGGAVLVFFLRRMFGIGFHSARLNAILSAIGALVIVPFHWRK